MIEEKLGGVPVKAIVECKNKRITAKERNQIIAQQSLIHQKMPNCTSIAVSSWVFSPDTRAALEKIGICCLTYAELLSELVPLSNYVAGLVEQYDTWIAEN